MRYNPAVLEAIIFWIGGIAAVQGLTEQLKKLWKNADARLARVLNYVASVVMALAVPAVFLALNDMFSVKSLLLYAIPIWLMATGIYDAFHTPKG